MLRLLQKILEAIGRGFDKFGSLFGGGVPASPPSPWEMERAQPFAETVERARQSVRPYHYSEFVSRWCQSADLGRKLPMKGLTPTTQSWLRSLSRTEIAVLADASIDDVRRHVIGHALIPDVSPLQTAPQPTARPYESFGGISRRRAPILDTEQLDFVGLSPA